MVGTSNQSVPEVATNQIVNQVMCVKLAFTNWGPTSWEPNEEFYGSKGPSPARLAKRKICQNGFLVTPCSLLYVYIHLYMRVSYFNLFILILSFWDAFEKPKTSMIIQVRPQPLSWINCGVQSCSRPNPKP